MTDGQLIAESINKLTTALVQATTHRYTLTGADDWELLVVLFAVIGFLIVLVGKMQDKRLDGIEKAITGNKTDSQAYCNGCRGHLESDIEELRDDFKNCQKGSCSRNSQQPVTAHPA